MSKGKAQFVGALKKLIPPPSLPVDADLHGRVEWLEQKMSWLQRIVILLGAALAVKVLGLNVGLEDIAAFLIAK